MAGFAIGWCHARPTASAGAVDAGDPDRQPPRTAGAQASEAPPSGAGAALPRVPQAARGERIDAAWQQLLKTTMIGGVHDAEHESFDLLGARLSGLDLDETIELLTAYPKGLRGADNWGPACRAVARQLASFPDPPETFQRLWRDREGLVFPPDYFIIDFFRSWAARDSEAARDGFELIPESDLRRRVRGSLAEQSGPG
jgi:hypothetical protein